MSQDMTVCSGQARFIQPQASSSQHHRDSSPAPLINHKASDKLKAEQRQPGTVAKPHLGMLCTVKHIQAFVHCCTVAGCISSCTAGGDRLSLHIYPAVQTAQPCTAIQESGWPSKANGNNICCPVMTATRSCACPRQWHCFSHIIFSQDAPSANTLCGHPIRPAT